MWCGMNTRRFTRTKTSFEISLNCVQDEPRTNFTDLRAICYFSNQNKLRKASSLIRYNPRSFTSNSPVSFGEQFSTKNWIKFTYFQIFKFTYVGIFSSHNIFSFVYLKWTQHSAHIHIWWVFIIFIYICEIHMNEDKIFKLYKY